MTLKEVAHITGLHKCVVKDIDKARVEDLYVTIDKDGKKTLIKPEQQARFIGIDEFKLHDGHKYATVILDMESGCILWLQTGKKKQVVYDFIEHVGLEWMSEVEGINQKIKTIRKKIYGLPDDEYFFLKLFDVSRQKWKAQIEQRIFVPTFICTEP